MSGIMIIGTGGAGGAIASYIKDIDTKDIPIVLLDSDLSNTSDTIPAFHVSLSTIDSKEKFEKAIIEIITPYTPSELIIVTGFIGKKTPLIMHRFQIFCAEAMIPLVVSGVTPFRFEGTKKEREVARCIQELEDRAVAVYPFSNETLNALGSTLSLETAVKINYKRIYNEVILPHFEQESNTTPAFFDRKDVLEIRTYSQAPVLGKWPQQGLPFHKKVAIALAAAAVGCSIPLILSLVGAI